MGLGARNTRIQRQKYAYPRTRARSDIGFWCGDVGRGVVWDVRTLSCDGFGGGDIGSGVVGLWSRVQGASRGAESKEQGSGFNVCRTRPAT